MAHFVMQNLERSFARLENHTDKETFLNLSKKNTLVTELYPYGGPLQIRLSQVYAAAALSQVCSTKWFKFLVQNGSAVYIIDSKKNILAP